MAKAILEITIQWQGIEAACQDCAACGDRCYLDAYQLTTNLGPTEIIVCGSCYDVISSHS